MDYFHIHAGFPLQVEMSDNAAVALHSIFQTFADRCRRFDATLRERMFPDAAADPAAFRERHEAGMHRAVSEAVERVLAAWAGHPRVTLDQTAVDDWFVVLAHARWLYVRRDADDIHQWAERGADWAVKVSWLLFVQSTLVAAVVTELSGGAG
jgi:hypothetical protein